MGMNKIKVDIFPGRVRLDGMNVPLAELESTVKELYHGFEFELCFVCGFASKSDVTTAKKILGLPL